MKRNWTEKEINFWVERIRAKRNDSPFFLRLNEFVEQMVNKMHEAEKLKQRLQLERDIEEFLTK